MKKTLLIVGGGGFIGGFIAQRAIELGYEVWVTVRQSTSHEFLQFDSLHFIVLDYDDSEQVKSSLLDAKPGDRGWQYIIYNLGATKAVDFPSFNRINFEYLREIGSTLKDTGCEPKLFLYMSSLSVIGPGDEINYTPYSGKELPSPNTKYGLSKVKAEQWLELQSGLPWVVFRATGVYGPHEQDYLMMIKSIDRHIDLGVGYKKQVLTFIYVEDLVQAMFDALAHPENVVHKKYIISEDRAYTQKEFRQIVKKELNRKFVIPLKLPLWLVWLGSYFSEKWGALHMKPSTLNRDKFKILKQRNWSTDIRDAKKDFGFNPKHSLKDGIKKTVEAYKTSKRS